MQPCIWVPCSPLEEEEYPSKCEAVKKDQLLKYLSEPKSNMNICPNSKNKCQCLWIDYVGIFNSPDLFTEKFLDVYSRGKNFPTDLMKVKVQTPVLFEISFPIILYEQNSESLIRDFAAALIPEAGDRPVRVLTRTYVPQLSTSHPLAHLLTSTKRRRREKGGRPPLPGWSKCQTKEEFRTMVVSNWTWMDVQDLHDGKT